MAVIQEVPQAICLAGQPVTMVVSEAVAETGIALKIDAAGTVSIADTAASDVIVGIAMGTASAANDLITMYPVASVVRCRAGEAIDEGAALTCESGGRLVATTTTGDYLAGHALEDAADGDLCMVLLSGAHNRYAATS